MPIPHPPSPPVQPRPEVPQDDDLVIRDEEGNYFWVRKEDYQQFPLNTPEFDQMTGQMEHLAHAQGAVLADIPQGALLDVDCACYLLNLDAIRKGSPIKSKSAAKTTNVQPSQQPGEDHGIHG